jgi:polyisoprenoid-binding protein YceI
MTIAEVKIPGYITGTWAIDPAYSYVGFAIRHVMLAKVRGRFESIHGQIVTDHDVLKSQVDVTIDAASFHTNNEIRNQHIRSADFLAVDTFPSLHFTSTGIHLRDEFLIEGDLTIADGRW